MCKICSFIILFSTNFIIELKAIILMRVSCFQGLFLTSELQMENVENYE